MGAKKKEGAKKKGGDDGEGDPSELNEVLEAAVESLRIKLVLEQERRDKSQSFEKSCQENEI